jgi:hypothetical protein
LSSGNYAASPAMLGGGENRTLLGLPYVLLGLSYV